MSQQQQPILTNEEQYRAELAALPRLSVAEQASAVERARRGDQEAAEQLILECMHAVEGLAYRLTVAYLPGGYLDLVQVGNLALVEGLERALDKGVQAPIKYLYAIARREMQTYVFYRSRLIRVPSDSPIHLQQAPTVVSLQDTGVLDELVADLQGGEQAGFTATYGALYEALSTLTDLERDAVARRHGIGEWDREDKTAETVVQRRYSRAVAHLRRYFKRA